MGRDDDSITENTDTTASLISECMSLTDLPIDLSDFLQLLANKRTRYLLYLLTERGGTVFLEEVEECFNNEEISTAFQHHQIPRLVDFHIIDYDSDAGAITLTPVGDDLRFALETIKSLEENAVNEFLDQTNRSDD